MASDSTHPFESLSSPNRMWDSDAKEQPQMWSTHDLACAHCRSRKIRCGRERPQCESCRRDGVECRYSSPGKRINHVKLLCQNFEALEDQLNTIQGDLSSLTSLIKSGSVARPAPAQGQTSSSEDFGTSLSTDSPKVTLRDRHILRDDTLLVERYHGPCSLFSLCKEFREDSFFETQDADTAIDNSLTIQMLLQQLCSNAGSGEHFDVPSSGAIISLPPRQFLSIVVTQFFRDADYATDIFVQTSFQRHLDRIYSQPLSPNDEVWAVCFNAIVLLAVGKDQSSQTTNPFVQPFLQILTVAANNPRVFLSPRIVNVQALALLSLVAEHYSTQGLAAVVFAQACLLAKTMGLHQSRAVCEGAQLEEFIERKKTFVSLYIRDKNSAICGGSPVWLPSYDLDCSFSPDGQDNSQTLYGARVELAQIQDEVYRQFQSANSPAISSPSRAQIVASLEQKLEHWTMVHKSYIHPATSASSASLMLSFLATRLSIYKGSQDQKIRKKAFYDAKASCILLLQAASSQPDPKLVVILDQLLFNKKPSNAKLSRSESSNNSSVSSSPIAQCDSQSIPHLPLLTAHFSLLSLFTVVRRILQPTVEGIAGDEMLGKPEEEVLLLEALRDRYACIVDHENTGNSSQRLRRTLELLVQIIRLKNSPHTIDPTPDMTFNDISSSNSGNSSRTDTPQGSDFISTNSSAMAMPSTEVASIPASSLLFPLMQPLDHFCTENGELDWMAGPYKQQYDGMGRVGKRPRLPAQTDLFDVTATFSESLGDDSMSMFGFLGMGNDISAFHGGE